MGLAWVSSPWVMRITSSCVLRLSKFARSQSGGRTNESGTAFCLQCFTVMVETSQTFQCPQTSLVMAADGSAGISDEEYECHDDYCVQGPLYLP